MNKIEEILAFWFEGVDDAVVINRHHMPFKKWFMKDPDFDEEIRRRFEDDLLAASDGKRQEWESSAHGRLALILMFDQFARNIYRQTPRMFSFDDKALALSRRMIADGQEEELMLIERVFLYLPFEHAEDEEMQLASVQGNIKLVEGAMAAHPANVAYYEYTLAYAQKHYAIIQRFGRFPHRNRILGRVSTKEEEEFLKQPNSGF